MATDTESADQHHQGKLVEAMEDTEAEDMDRDRDMESTHSISSSRVTSHQVPRTSSKGSSSSCRASPVSSSSIHLATSSSSSPGYRLRHTS